MSVRVRSQRFLSWQVYLRIGFVSLMFYTIEVGGRLTDHRKLTCTRDAPQLLLTVRTTGGWNATGDHNRGPQLGTTAGWNATPDHKIACDFGCGSEF